MVIGFDPCIAHRISTLATCERPYTVTGMRSFVGTFKVLSRVILGTASILDPLEASTINLKDGKCLINWTDELIAAFRKAQLHLRENKIIQLPRVDDKLWIVTDGATVLQGLGATMYTTQGDSKLALAGFFSAKLRPLQKGWLPCKVEALAIAAAIKHFAPFLIQARLPATVLTDSKPCIQAIHRLCRGEFSASPRITTFLSAVARYGVLVCHLKGSVNLVSDFVSRNAPPCDNPSCQICHFISEMASSAVYASCVGSIEDVSKGRRPLPYSIHQDSYSTGLSVAAQSFLTEATGVGITEERYQRTRC